MRRGQSFGVSTPAMTVLVAVSHEDDASGVLYSKHLSRFSGCFLAGLMFAMPFRPPQCFPNTHAMPCSSHPMPFHCLQRDPHIQTRYPKRRMLLTQPPQPLKHIDLALRPGTHKSTPLSQPLQHHPSQTPIRSVDRRGSEARRSLYQPRNGRIAAEDGGCGCGDGGLPAVFEPGAAEVEEGAGEDYEEDAAVDAGSCLSADISRQSAVWCAEESQRTGTGRTGTI